MQKQCVSFKFSDNSQWLIICYATVDPFHKNNNDGDDNSQVRL